MSVEAARRLAYFAVLWGAFFGGGMIALAAGADATEALLVGLGTINLYVAAIATVIFLRER